MAKSQAKLVRIGDRGLRLAFCQTLLGMLHVGHAARFSTLSFAKSIPLIVVYCAVMSAFIDGKNTAISSVARSLGFSHETARRHLRTLTKFGLLVKVGREYEPAERVYKTAQGFGRVRRLIKDAAKFYSPIC